MLGLSVLKVGVGSSGGLMGVLAAWAVFIMITW